MPRKNKKDKRQKPKVVYYDDYSTVADMSKVTDIKGGKQRKKEQKLQADSSAKDKLSTFFAAMKQMVFPMMVVLAVLFALYLLLMLLSGGFS